MGIATGIVAYLIIWWCVLFAVLPIGVRGQWEDDERVEGTEPGAPVAAQLWRKALITSAIAAVFWLALLVGIRLGLFNSLRP